MSKRKRKHKPGKLITDDAALRAFEPDDPRLTDADRSIMRTAATGEGAITLTREKFEELAQAAEARMAEFRATFATMTLADAVFVRNLRVGEGYTWRAVAAACAQAWSGPWGTNQLAGMALCERAARMCGEDPNEAPWNESTLEQQINEAAGG